MSRLRRKARKRAAGDVDQAPGALSQWSSNLM